MASAATVVYMSSIQGAEAQTVYAANLSCAKCILGGFHYAYGVPFSSTAPVVDSCCETASTCPGVIDPTLVLTSNDVTNQQYALNMCSTASACGDRYVNIDAVTLSTDTAITRTAVAGPNESCHWMFTTACGLPTVTIGASTNVDATKFSLQFLEHAVTPALANANTLDTTSKMAGLYSHPLQPVPTMTWTDVSADITAATAVTTGTLSAATFADTTTLVETY
jgi:hypothetical protein